MKKNINNDSENIKNENNTTVEQPKKTSKIKKFFNGLYILSLVLSFLYYAFYVGITIKKAGGLNGIVPILLLVFVIVYAITLIVCAIISSSMKTAKKRIKAGKQYINYFYKIIKLISAITSITVLYASLTADNLELLPFFVSLVSLIFTIIKVILNIFKMTTSIGLKVTKHVVKKKVGAKKDEIIQITKSKYSDMKKSIGSKFSKKVAPEELPTDATNDLINEDN